MTIKCDYLTDDIIHDLEAELRKEDRLSECFVINAIPLTTPITFKLKGEKEE